MVFGTMLLIDLCNTDKKFGSESGGVVLLSYSYEHKIRESVGELGQSKVKK